MKFSVLFFCLVSSVVILSNSKITEAASTEKTLKKGGYAPYTGPQQDWPRSDKHPVPIEIGRAGVIIFDQFPDRPYEVIGTVSSSGDLFVKHASLAAAAVGAQAILVIGDKAFTDAGITIQPHWIKNVRMPDPAAPPPDLHRLDHPDQIKSSDTPPTILVNELAGIAIRWKRP